MLIFIIYINLNFIHLIKTIYTWNKYCYHKTINHIHIDNNMDSYI